MIQLDFIGNSMPRLTQGDLFEPAKTGLNVSCVDEFFLTLSSNEIDKYKKYWESKIPKDIEKVFHRWLFAFLSVHTTWEGNVKGFLAIRDIDKWVGKSRDKLRNLLIGSGVGLHNNRTRYISEFSDKFWANIFFYSKGINEGWAEYRDRIEAITLGLQKAKTSFAIEMCNPLSGKVFCADIHMLRLFGLNQKSGLKHYKKIEDHWVERSAIFNVAPYIARLIYWNRVQQKEICDYWAHCLP